MAQHGTILKRIGIIFLSFIAVLSCVIVYLAYTTFANFARAEKTSFDLARLKAPPGFHISVFAEEVDGARMMAFSPGGVLLVSESGEGNVVALPDPKHRARPSGRFMSSTG
jgi:glucose/arabinose dehydrogenase